MSPHQERYVWTHWRRIGIQATGHYHIYLKLLNVCWLCHSLKVVWMRKQEESLWKTIKNSSVMPSSILMYTLDPVQLNSSWLNNTTNNIIKKQRKKKVRIIKMGKKEPIHLCLLQASLLFWVKLLTLMLLQIWKLRVTTRIRWMESPKEASLLKLTNQRWLPKRQTQLLIQKRNGCVEYETLSSFEWLIELYAIDHIALI